MAKKQTKKVIKKNKTTKTTKAKRGPGRPPGSKNKVK